MPYRRAMPCSLPPKDSKDVREWLATEVRKELPWHKRGAELLRILEANSVNAIVPADTGGCSPNAPEIMIGTDYEFRVNAEACAATPDGNVIFTSAWLADASGRASHRTRTREAAIRRPIGSLNIRELAKPLLRERLTRCIHGGWNAG